MLVNSPIDLPLGEYNAVIVLEEQPISRIQTSVREAQAILRKYLPVSRNISQ
ncbi:hypothetical protein [Nostoc sp. CENA543]|uniref:hypothetical protein n=1 Tax=Nostoc sp. CENA543 TaxID=1869241 RepID=UPI001CEF6686|nr:hypothetical protein [Nostoc sp. CENA543]